MCKFILWVLFYIDRSRKVPPTFFPGEPYGLPYERKQHFKGPKIHVKTWMKKRFDEEGRAFLTADLGSAKELARLLRQIPDERKKRAVMCFHWAKYGNFDTGKPFLPQYERNLKVLREYLKELTE